MEHLRGRRRHKKFIKTFNSSIDLGTLYNRNDSSIKIVPHLETDEVKRMNKTTCRLLRPENCLDKRRLYEQLGFDVETLDIIEKQPSSLNVEILRFFYLETTIENSMRFIHYVHRAERTKLRTRKHGTHIYVKPDEEIKKYTDMVTKTIKGVEFLLVVHIQNPDVREADQFLEKFCKKLKNRQSILEMLDKRSSFIDIMQAQVFGIEENSCQKSFAEISREIDTYLRSEHFVSIEYQIKPLDWLYDKTRYSHKRTRYIKKRKSRKNLKNDKSAGSLKRHSGSAIRANKFLSDDEHESDSSDTTELDHSCLDLTQLDSTFCLDSGHIMFTINRLPESQGLSISDKTNPQETEFELKSEQMLIQCLVGMQLDYLPFENTGKEVQEQILNRKKQHESVLWNHESDTQGDMFPSITFIQSLCAKIDKDNIQSFIYVSESSTLAPNISFEIFLWKSLDSSITESEESSNETEDERKEITVLLLGESGVGKSTFINALVNYLLFDTLEDAEKNDSIALIPVSFLTTVNSNFDCVQVKYGDVDQNENHEKIGSSVTQRCRSYILEVSSKIQIRLIDTPGFCDTVGIDKDTHNMSEIFMYLAKVRHLNAICFLMKPDSTRLTIQFRRVFDMMLRFLPIHQRQNVLFCFTNTRARFYSPAETGTLVRTLLKEKDFDGVDFSTRNVFCFDSESFRFLMAKKQNIEFDDDIIEEYKRSWTVSVKEAGKLLREVSKTPEIKFYEHRSVNFVEAEIRNLSHVFMETLRYLVYCLVLRNELSNNRILNLTCESSKNEFCSMCADIQRDVIDGFPIFQFRHSKKMCDHSNPNAFMIYHEVKYEFTASNKGILKKPSVDDSTTIFKKFYLLSCFLNGNDQMQCENLFLTMIDRFIDEQRQITVENQATSKVNQCIQSQIGKVRENIQQDENHQKNSKKCPSLEEARELINELEKEPIIAKQIRCLREVQQRILNEEQRRIPFKSFRSQRFLQLRKSFRNHEDGDVIITRL